MAVQTQVKGNTSDGRPVKAFLLENDFMRVECLELGATLSKLEVKKDGQWKDIVLGYDDIEGYEEDDASIGATVGRFANRIDRGKFTIDGQEYSLEINNEPNHLHGGSKGCKHLLWDGHVEGDSVVFSTVMKESDDAYPGDLSVSVIYSLDGTDLKMKYIYSSTKNSIANFTNHTYFNLVGEGAIYNHILQLEAPYYTPVNSEMIPTGKVEKVAGTMFDFREPQNLGEMLCNNYEKLGDFGNGYDHNFLLTEDASYGEIKLMGTISVPGLAVQVLSDAPGFQLYTSNYLLVPLGKDNHFYETHWGVCIEPQFLPNDINTEGYKDSFIEANKEYSRTIVYRVIAQ